jgi:hypothetical protein
MEEDATIFKDIFQRLIVDPISEVLKKQRLDDEQHKVDSDC